MPRWMAILCVCLGMLLVFACSAARHRVISLNNADDGRSISSTAGDEIDIKLQTIGPGQYGDPSYSSGLLQFLGVADVKPYLPAGPTQLYRFNAVKPGHGKISIPHAGSFPGSPAKDFSIDIDVH